MYCNILERSDLVKDSAYVLRTNYTHMTPQKNIQYFCIIMDLISADVRAEERLKKLLVFIEYPIACLLTNTMPSTVHQNWAIHSNCA